MSSDGSLAQRAEQPNQIHARTGEPAGAAQPPVIDPVVDVEEIIEGRKPGWFAVRLVLACSLVTFFDGFDLNVIAYAAPYLAAEYTLDRQMLANIFSSGIAGTLVGGFLFGFVGDRIGRRAAIILATSIFGVLTLALAFGDRYWEFLLLRFVSGIALGGAIPLIWALSVEYVPRRYRATIVTLVSLGYGLGVTAAGPVSVGLIPHFGWPSVFVFGGGFSCVSIIVLYFALPESLRFLATRPDRSEAAAKIVARLDPTRRVPAGTRFVLSGQRDSAPGARGPAVLLQGQLRLITPLLWLAYASSSMATFFFANWGPIVLEEMGLTRTTAAWTSSAKAVAGALGGLALMRFTDRVGVISLAFLPAAAVPFLLTIGFVPLGQEAFIVMIVLLFVFLGGSHYGIISVAGTFYPTRHRALGTGWAASIGKLGSVLGPLLGGWILAANLPTERAFAVLAICPAIYFGCLLWIGLKERSGRIQAAA